MTATKRNRWTTTLAVLGGMMFVAPKADAGEWSVRLGVGLPVVSTTRYAPVQEVRTRRVWVEPIYEQRTVRVRVPGRTIKRQVPVYDRFGRVARYRVVLERTASRVELRTERVLVREGYYQTVTEALPTQVTTVSYSRPGLSFSFGRHKNRLHRSRAIRVGHRY